MFLHSKEVTGRSSRQISGKGIHLRILERIAFQKLFNKNSFSVEERSSHSFRQRDAGPIREVKSHFKKISFVSYIDCQSFSKIFHSIS